MLTQRGALVPLGHYGNALTDALHSSASHAENLFLSGVLGNKKGGVPRGPATLG